MAYNNSGCNTCTPICIPPVTAPPACVGSECEEIYPGACVVYSGPNIDCLGVTNGMSLNDILQIIAEKLCSEECCTNPVEWLLQYAKNIYDIHVAKGLTPNIVTILSDLINNGIFTGSCNICCPDWQWYIISNKTQVGLIKTAIGIQGPPTNDGLNNFTECMLNLEQRNVLIPNRFVDNPSEALSGTEWGTIQGQTTLCLFNDIFNAQTFSGSILYDILDLVIEIGLTVDCSNGFLKILSMTDFLTDNINP